MVIIKKKYNEIRVDVLMVLCHILDDFEDFRSSEYIKSLIFDYNLVEDISRNGSKLLCGPANVFCKRHKNVLDIINKYMGFENFMKATFSLGSHTFIGEVNCFYNYLVAHRDSLDSIISLLEKMQELGIFKICCDDSVDFKNEKNSICIRFSGNDSLNYFENMKAVPNSTVDRVSYITTGSKYKIRVLGEYPMITVNDLLFDGSLLPDSIDPQILFDEIMKLRTAVQGDNQRLISYVDAATVITELNLKYYDLKKIFGARERENPENREALRNLLSEFLEVVKGISEINSSYGRSIVEGSENLTPELLEEDLIYTLNKRAENSGNVYNG